MPNRSLEFFLSLRDQMSEPLKKVTKQFDDIKANSKAAMGDIAYGVAGITAAGASLYSAISPAIEIDRSLGELNSLNVSTAGIQAVEDEALILSAKIGASALDITKSAYGVKKALNGINDLDLARANNAVNLLAVVTKGSTEQATAYMGTMYGIYKKQAKEMGEAQFAEMIAAKTEKATTLFNASVGDFQAGFGALKNGAKMYGIAIEEQIAVMGSLKDITDSGGSAAGMYNKMLKNMGKAQSELGVSFKDSQGKMLSMPAILDRLKAKFGKAIPSDKLIKAFGTEGAKAIQHLMANADQLKTGIDSLKNTQGVDGLTDKAMNATDGFLQLGSALTNMKIAIFDPILNDYLYPAMSYLAKLATNAVAWLKSHQSIAKAIGIIGAGLILIAGVVPALTALSGIFKMMSLGSGIFSLSLKAIVPLLSTLKIGLLGLLKGALAFFGTLTAPLTLIFVTIGAVIFYFRKEIGAFIDGFIDGFRSVSGAFDPILNAFARLWGAVQRVWAKVADVFGLTLEGGDNLQAWANAGVIVGQAVGNALSFVAETLGILIDGVAILFEGFINTFAGILNTFLQVGEAFANGNWIDAFKLIGQGILNAILGVFDTLKKAFGTVWNWIADKLNLTKVTIPVEMKEVGGTINAAQGVATLATGAIGLANPTTPPKIGNGTMQPKQYNARQDGNISQTLTKNRTTNVVNNTTINNNGVTPEEMIKEINKQTQRQNYEAGQLQ